MEKRFYTPEEKEIGLVRQEFMCGECGADLWQEVLGYCQAHHILPYGMGGETSIANLVILCPNCHVVHDNMAVCGTMYGGIDITEMEPEQIRDQGIYEKSIGLSRINAGNPKIQKTIFNYRQKIWKQMEDQK